MNTFKDYFDTNKDAFHYPPTEISIEFNHFGDIYRGHKCFLGFHARKKENTVDLGH